MERHDRAAWLRGRAPLSLPFRTLRGNRLAVRGAPLWSVPGSRLGHGEAHWLARLCVGGLVRREYPCCFIYGLVVRGRADRWRRNRGVRVSAVAYSPRRGAPAVV